MDWKKAMYRRVQEDPWYQTCLRRVNETEGAFLKNRNALPPEQQEQLDEYIAACEELEHSLIYIVREMERL